MTKSILQINASLVPEQSASLKLSNNYLDNIRIKTDINVVTKDLSIDIERINANWIAANFTPDEDRSSSQKQILAFSNSLIDEINQADEIVLASPMYNFTIPANLKAYFDLIARVGVSFKYTDKGPVGLIKDKPVTVIITTGGTEVGSNLDFMSPYIIQMFHFIGISNITIVAADKRSIDAESSFKNATIKLKELAN